MEAGDVLARQLIDSACPEGLRDQSLNGLSQLISLVEDPRKRVAFFVGAGISKPLPSALPLAGELVTRILNGLAVATTASAEVSRAFTWMLDRSVSDGRTVVPLERLVGSALDMAGASAIELLDVFNIQDGARRYNDAHAFLANWLGERRGAVLTPNYDELIESACLDILSESATDTRAGKRNPHDQLYKLHGTISRRDSIRIAFQHIGARLPPSLGARITQELASSHGCFVGWAAADIDILPVIETVLVQAHSRDRQWYFVLHPDPHCNNIADYTLRHAQAIEFATRLNLPIIVARSEVLFRKLNEHLFGAAGRGQHALQGPDQDDIPSVVVQMAVDHPSLPGRMAAHILHILEDYARAEKLYGVAKSQTIADSQERVQIILQQSHAAFDGHRRIAALRYAAEASATARDDNVQMQAYWGIVTQMLSLKWWDEFSVSRDTVFVPFLAIQLLKLPYRLLRLHLLCRSTRFLPSTKERDEGKSRLAALWVWEVAALMRLMRPLLRRPTGVRLRRRLERRIMAAREVHFELNELDHYYSDLRWLARIKSWDGVEEAIACLSEARRICRGMGWGLAVKLLERDISAIETRLSDSKDVPSLIRIRPYGESGST